MKIINSFLTNNDCYKANKKIVVEGLILHSVGCPQPKSSVFINTWNKPNVEKCVHGFIEPGYIYQTLPWNHRGWHCGGSGNNKYIGVEMTEPNTIKYTGGSSWVETSGGMNTKNHVLGTYKTAVELFAYLCKEFKLDPLKDGVILSHSEAHKRGIASNHGDVEHIWTKFGLTMNQFRKDVKAAMTTQTKLFKVQVGAFSVKNNATNLHEKLKAAGFDTYIVQVGKIYKVQVGAYSVKANAEVTIKKLKAAGFDDCFITYQQ